MMVTSEISRLPVEAPALPLTAAVAVTAAAATGSGSVGGVTRVECAAPYSISCLTHHSK
jgi:hypothetical protein